MSPNVDDPEDFAIIKRNGSQRNGDSITIKTNYTFNGKFFIMPTKVIFFLFLMKGFVAQTIMTPWWVKQRKNSLIH